MRFIGSDAVLHALRCTAGNDRGFARALPRGISLCEAVDQVVFNTATRNRTYHRACFAQGHDGANRAGRRAPCANDSGQQSALPCLAPVAQCAQDHDINIFHRERL